MPDYSPDTPVLVGVGAVTQQLENYREALEPVALMEQALRLAAQDAGCPALLSRADEILVPNSLWGYTDPGRLLAVRFDAPSAVTVLADFGILQQSLLTRACTRIASGDARVVLVTGGEARYRAQCAARAAAKAAETPQADARPDVFLRPEAELMSEVEAGAGLGMPVGYYAIMDSALRYQQGQSLSDHRDEMARCYARLSAIAAANPDAWVREPVAAAVIREHSAANRMLAFPYTKLHNSQWNVDQASGLILCAARVADELGIARDRWVFPWAAAESNFMTVISARADLGGSEGFRATGRAVQALAGLDFAAVRLRELYSCFPLALRVQQREFALPQRDDVSVTGGMTFAGGPLNNFVLQATAKMAQLLRLQPGEVGLVTSVSGLLTKQACALWSTAPPPRGWASADVTAEVRAATQVRELVPEYAGEARVAGYTVLYQGMDPWRAVAVFDLPDGRRTVAYSEDAGLMDEMLSRECCGDRHQLQGGRFR